MNAHAPRAPSIRPSWGAGAPSDYARREFVHWPGWRNLIGWDVFLNNLAAGIFMVTLAGWWLAPGPMTGVVAPALALCWLVLVADLLVLVTDLGDPWRFLHMLRVVKRTSPMSVGVWSLSTFATLLTVVAAAVWLPWPAAHAAAKLLAVVAAVPVLGVLLYKGVLFSCTAQPGLRDARWLGAHFAASALMLGAAATLLVASVLDASAQGVLRAALAALLLPAAATLAALVRDVTPRARQRYPDVTRALLAAGVGIGGLLVPLLLLVVVPGRGVYAMASLLALAGGLVTRHAVIRLAEPVTQPVEPSALA